MVAVQDVPGGTADRAAGASCGRLLALIRSGGDWTRQQLLEATGMSRPTLLARLGPLITAGLVYETGSLAAPRGRPAQLIRFDDRRLRILVLDIGHRRTRIGVTDIGGRVLRSCAAPDGVRTGDPDGTLPRILDIAGELLAACGAGRERLIGVGTGLPAPVDPHRAAPGRPGTATGWRELPVGRRVRERWPVPVVLENDARALAVGEARQQGADTFLAVTWGHGLGAGLVVGGRLLGGEDGSAGDIAHVRVAGGHEPRCLCGRYGCLAAHASGHALCRRLGAAGLEDLVARHRAGEREVTAALVTAGEQVGRVLAPLTAMLNPGGLVLSGLVGRLPAVGEAVERELRANALSLSATSLRVTPAVLGENAVTAGLAHRVAEHALDPSVVDACLGTAAAAGA